MDLRNCSEEKSKTGNDVLALCKVRTTGKYEMFNIYSSTEYTCDSLGGNELKLYTRN